MGGLSGRGRATRRSRCPLCAADRRGQDARRPAHSRGKLRYQPIGFKLLPEKFTISELQWLYERILEQELDNRNFRKKLYSLGILKVTDEFQQDVAHRAARLYRFDHKRYHSLVKEGLHFEL